MKNSPDPAVHRRREQEMLAHFQRLLSDERLRVETATGSRVITSLLRNVSRADGAMDLKRQMTEAGVYDRQVQNQMPLGESIEVTLGQKQFWLFSRTVGRLKIVCVSPVKALLKGEPPAPLDAQGVQRLLGSMPSSLGGVPQTLILVGTAGFTAEAHGLARRAGGQTLVMVEPGEAGGWMVTAPPEAAGLAGLLDPERDDDKRQRVRDALEASESDLLLGGLSAEKVAAKLRIPQPMVDEVVKQFAKAHPGLAARKIDGSLLLYRDGVGESLAGVTGENMPFWEKIKGVFSRTESPDKKIGRLSAEKAGMVMQRDRAYAEIETIEKKETELTASFQSATALAQKRIATEISQLRKRVERQQQVVATIDKKINIIETGVHNLQMEEHVRPERLEALEEAAQASEHVDVGMATLEQLNEQADAVSVAGGEMSNGAQDVLAELQAKFAKPAEPAKTAEAARTAPPLPSERAGGRLREPPLPADRRRSEPAEPG